MDLSQYDLSSIRYEFSAAVTMPQEVSRRWSERFKRPVFEGYGLTESRRLPAITTTSVTSSAASARKKGYWGKPPPPP
ncbi:MAG TPA: hypothetical protein VJO34_16730 [Methylomirabilota bacterium]|nr:hypothetical protein [Methylomirabilota bacterium]